MSGTSMRAFVLAAVAVLSCAVTTAAADARTSKPEQRQNSAINKSANAAKKAGSAAKKADSAARKADAKAAAAALAATRAISDARTANTGVGTLNTSVVPAALQALTEVKNGLTALRDGLAAATAGLARLGTVVQSDEYGVVQIAFGAAPGTPVPGCFYESGDIPDNAQDAIVTGTCLIPNTVPSGAAVHLLTGIRSNESDGVAGGPAAGVAGLVAYAQTGVTAANQGGGVANVSVVTPLGGGVTVPVSPAQPPAAAIPLKSPPTSATETGFPFAPMSTDKLTTDLAVTQFSGTPSTPVFGDPATTPNRSIQFTVRFNDLTTDPNDPAA